MTNSDRQAADYRAEASERAAPSGLRTERVTLEITHSEPSSAASWAWANWTIPGESVRVVKEDITDDEIRLTVERDTAMRERDSLREQLESVADRAAAAETALESAPAASGAAGTEPVAWGVIVQRDSGEVCCPFAVREAAQHFVRLNSVNETMQIVPLYAAPQPAKGWLTPEEREALRWVCSITPIDKAEADKQFSALRNLRRRSTPPEVVFTAVSSYENAPGNRVLAACDVISAIRKAGCEVVTPRHWQLAAAGVAVKEVGRE
jgi:hypothetical protein